MLRVLSKTRRAVHRMRRLSLYILALILCLIPPIFVKGLFGYLPLLLLLAMSALSLAYLGVLKTSLRYEDLSQMHTCTRGEDMTFRIQVENRSILVYPMVKLSFRMTGQFEDGASASATAAITLAPLEKRTFSFDVRFDHLGQYAVGLGQVEVYGPLGVLACRLPGGTEHVVQVTPHIWELDTLPLSKHVQAEDSRAHSSAAVGGLDYTGVRTYVAGDPIKNIHWKLSAHTREYLTKQRETFGSTGVTVILDLCCPPCGNEAGMCMLDALVESAAAICHYAQENGMEGDLTFLDRGGGECLLHCRDDSVFLELMEQLPPVVWNRKDYPVEQLLRRAGGTYGKNNVAFCTACVSEEAVRLLQNLKLSRRNPMLFFILPKDVDDQEREKRLASVRTLDGMGISYLIVSSAEELQTGGGLRK